MHYALAFEPQGAQTARVSRAVDLFWWPDAFVLRTDYEDVSGEALVSAPPMGGRQGVYHSSVRVQIAGMSRAICLFTVNRTR
eukprot:2414051-Pyramimonas_sp.AAC.1